MENLDAAELNIRRRCTGYLAETLKVPPKRIDPQTKFARFGRDSAMPVFFLVALEEWLGVELGSGTVFDYPTIAELARHVAGRFPQAAAAAAIATAIVLLQLGDNESYDFIYFQF